MAGSPVVIRTAGDLWKCLAEGRTPGIECSAFRIGGRVRGGNVVEVTDPRESDQRPIETLDRALALVEQVGCDRTNAIRALIARVALQRGATRASVVNMPLSEFVAAIDHRSASAAVEVPATGQSNTARDADDEPISRLDEICGYLTPTQQRIVRYLWNRKHHADPEGLARACAMSPDPEAIKRAFNRLAKRLVELQINDVHLDFNRTGRVKLIHP